jgi:transposase
MARLLQTNDEWNVIEDLFGEPAATGRPWVDRGMVLDGIFWVLRTGSPPVKNTESAGAQSYDQG